MIVVVALPFPTVLEKLDGPHWSNILVQCAGMAWIHTSQHTILLLSSHYRSTSNNLQNKCKLASILVHGGIETLVKDLACYFQRKSSTHGRSRIVRFKTKFPYISSIASLYMFTFSTWHRMVEYQSEVTMSFGFSLEMWCSCSESPWFKGRSNNDRCLWGCSWWCQRYYYYS